MRESLFVGGPPRKKLVTNFACATGQSRNYAIKVIHGISERHYRISACTGLALTSSLDLEPSQSITVIFGAGVSKVGGKLTLPCTREGDS